MINTVWESAVWQSDMQLIGKVALSATAVVILALAYRFYKLRQLESTEPNSQHDPAGGTDKSASTTETPLRDYIGDETGHLRLRSVHNNLQSSSVTDRRIKNLQEGLLPDDVTCKDQKGLKSEEPRLRKDDPLQSLPQRRDHRDGQGDECKTQNPDCRQDPEGREMQEKSVLADGSAGQDSKDSPPSHKKQTEEEHHQTIPTPMKDEVTADGGPTPMKDDVTADGGPTTMKDDLTADGGPTTMKDEVTADGGPTTMKDDVTADGGPTPMKDNVTANCGPTPMKDNVTANGGPTPMPTEMIMENSPQSPTDEVDLHIHTEVHGHQPILNDLPSSTAISIKTQLGATNNSGTKDETQVEKNQSQELSEDHEETEGNKDKDTKTQGIQINMVPSVHASSSSSTQQDQDSDMAAQPGPNTYRIALDGESFLDIHLNLENCYDVLCLAKKHNHDALLAAAYKTMTNDYLQVLQNPTIYGRLNATERDLILEGRMKGKRFVVVADIDTQANNAPENKSSLSYYDRDNDRWHALSHIPREAVSRGCSMATLFNYIFIVLGSDGLDRQMKPTKRVLCYNPLTNCWREVAPLKDARPHCKLVALDGCLYAIGGECLHTVERYDPRLNRWSYIAPLPNDTFAVAHMATAYDEEIYVTGGTIRYLLLRYNLREKMWKNSHISGSKDRTTEIIATGNFLYRFDLNRNMGISAHRCNIRARIWYECATYAMPYPAPFQCVVIDNSIFCLSRNFHLRFLADDVSPRFVEVDLQTVPSPKGLLYPLVLVLPFKGVQ